MNKKNKLIYGVGTNDYSGSVSLNGKHFKSYNCWRSMLHRCYSAKCEIRYPTYIGCIVCEEWLSFNTFKKFYDKNYKEGFHLDKDILIEGNKIYSAEACAFVPGYINQLLVDRENARGDLPLGIIKNGNSYMAQCSRGYNERSNKTFKTIEQAQAWYSITKQAIVKEQALRAFMANEIKSDVYLALVRRKF